MQSKWYQSTVLTIVFLIVFFPLGLFLMWKHAKWNTVLKGVITAFFAVLFIVAILNPKEKPEDKTNIDDKPASQTAQETTPSTEAKPIFDVASLMGKNIDEVRGVLGTPSDNQPEPTAQQNVAGVDWDNTFKKNGKTLQITFNPNSRKVTDFFCEGENEQELLKNCGVSKSATNYSVETVKQLQDNSKITGILITPNQ